MEEKQSIKISLSTALLIIAIIVIIAMVCYIYIARSDFNKEISNLETNTAEMQNTIETLQEKLNSISNTINSESTKNNDETLSIGNYTVNEVKFDEGGVSNSECGVELKENGKFVIYMGYGAWHSGKYEIKNDTLICKSNLLEWESGNAGSSATNVIFTFDIVSNNKLKLSNIKINDTNNEKLVYKEGLSIGMTYSIKQ